MLLIVPGLFLLTIWSVVAPVVVIERPGVFAAFGRSRELVRGYGWQVFGVIVVVILIAIVVAIIVEIMTRAWARRPRDRAVGPQRGITAPLSALLVSVLYFGLRRVHGESGVATAGAQAGPEVPGTWAPPEPPTQQQPPATPEGGTTAPGGTTPRAGPRPRAGRRPPAARRPAARRRRISRR